MCPSVLGSKASTELTRSWYCRRIRGTERVVWGTRRSTDGVRRRGWLYPHMECLRVGPRGRLR
eukprot:1587516-Rhodomonas_salina.1